MAAVRSPRATPGTKPPTPSGGGWFDVGGKERIELASRNEALGEEVRLKEAQLRMLRVLQKTSAREGRIDRWRLQTTAPVFSAWRRAVTAWRAERQLEAERAARAAAVSAAEEKGGQVGALADRVARVKSNAQAKLSELSAANQLLAKALRGPQPPAEAALEEKDKAAVSLEARVKHLQRTAGAQGEREVELSLKLEQQADALAQGERERQRLEAAAAAARRESDAQREAGSAAVANEAAAAMALRTTLGALRAADSELQVARGEWLSRQRRLLAEAACLKAEAAAARTLAVIDEGPRSATPRRMPASRQAARGQAGQTLLELHLDKWQRALLATCVPRAEREPVADAEARVEAVWRPREERQVAHVAALAASLRESEAGAAELSAHASELAERLRVETEARESLASQLSATAAALAEDEARTLALLDRQRAARAAMLGKMSGGASSAASSTPPSPGALAPAPLSSPFGPAASPAVAVPPPASPAGQGDSPAT
ncbi:hypothetical protein EMIHUDRAFT_109290 [Emiliania huxleyi CCMP1516]|uniref:Uncharacterized protein n=2 Tax=Emiliania huxleyi TaxID=2903 RepID=A0A0D3KS72_EMIH1|nr:hypothetical protein EMIHUDRAFT_109290 [Emiliania huxleyi CCMP1516]EOD38607.1 hypothetical protein EMIHUDRAFT_109290 [Emiliania huxleyi CCMP1516]|eukprot:XP_005791036.1 hypothetical protein EMIHUDRAFT_109290 [Emiliania huxleyi CCMP1516]